MSIEGWLLRAETRDLSSEALVSALCGRLRDGGIPVERAAFSVRTMHPEVWVQNVRWSASEGPRSVARPHTLTRTKMYTDSPVAHIHEGGDGVRQRLDGSPRAVSYPVFDELAAQGMTDYLIEPLLLAGGVRSFISWSTTAAGGFTDGHIDALRGLTPALAAVVDHLGQRHGLHSLMRAYLGDAAADRVLAGAVTRGAGQEIPCAVAFTDLRGFTRFTESNPPEVVLQALDRAFDTIGTAVRDHGGDIIKFIGDALLAIYPANDATGMAGAAKRAVDAAEAALAAFDDPDDRPILRAGIGVNLGRVFFGNVGTTSRLDFTLVGAAVNRAARLEAMCGTLKVPLVISADVAAHLGDRAVPLGEHALKGIGEPQALYTSRAVAGR